MSIEIWLKSWNVCETKTWKSDAKKFKKRSSLSQDLTESKKGPRHKSLRKHMQNELATVGKTGGVLWAAYHVVSPFHSMYMIVYVYMYIYIIYIYIYIHVCNIIYVYTWSVNVSTPDQWYPIPELGLVGRPTSQPGAGHWTSLSKVLRSSVGMIIAKKKHRCEALLINTLIIPPVNFRYHYRFRFK